MHPRYILELLPLYFEAQVKNQFTYWLRFRDREVVSWDQLFAMFDAAPIDTFVALYRHTQDNLVDFPAIALQALRDLTEVYVKRARM